ncbi:MAG: hypothetical protein KJZ86_24630 [Caldilineaceae bacterium]|nr:hypothetical protein [Caldilineaceae bacterium]HRJ41180.1 hypothetical protein [Caldilineaceae bacterium]
MQLSSLLPALSVALLAALGNGLFAYGQRRAEVVANPFLFILSALIVCAVAFGISMPLLPGVDGVAYLRRNWPWALVSGAGFYFTFLGFYFLYSRFGASHYALYAVLSILTTSVLVGIVLMREQVNGFHLAAIGCALLTVVLFAIGQSRI